MRIFVAGATGVVGRRTVRLLVDAGHEVTAVARSDDRADMLRSLGARPVRVDVFDGAALIPVVAGNEVVCNLTTHVPPMSRAALPGAWNDNERIRREVSVNLVDAALAGGATRVIQESLAFFYRDGGAEWITENDPLDLPAYARSAKVAEAAVARFTAAGRAGVVLRFGLFYGPDSHTTASTVALVRNGIAPFLGADGYVPSIATDDVATAVVAALSAPAGVYNVVDEPVTHAEYVASLASAADVRAPRVLPAALGAAMGSKAAPLSRSQRVSNRKFREATGWTPRWASVREGWPDVLAAMPSAPVARPNPVARILLALLALSYLVQGAWALFAPRSFYDSFPGFGHHWVDVDGPFNEHLLRDVGGLSLTLVVVLAAAALVPRVALVRTAAVAALVFAVPHLAYHATHLDTVPGVDGLATMVSLALAVLVPGVVLVLSFRRFATRAAGTRPQ